MSDTARDFFTSLVKNGNVKQVLLGDNGEQISNEEVAEVLGLLPDFNDKNVLELGSGAGRFTGVLSEKAQSLTAVDFLPEFITANKARNGTKSNITFVESNVLELPKEQDKYDLAFSNVMLAFLTDEQCRTLMSTLLGSLKEGSHFFFHEPCFNAGKRVHVTGDPTIYRDLASYCALLQSCSIKTETGCNYGFELVFARSLQTYVKHERTLNQICFLAKKVRLADDYHGYKTFMEFLDGQQYTRQGILRYEKIFGHHFVSTGGIETTKEFLPMLNLQPGQKVLDVGVGIGGSAFLMVDDYDCEVLGIDLSGNMISIGIERVNEERAENTKVLFEVVDATKVQYPENEFDVIYSRDTILHIPDKHALFSSFLKWLKPGGKLLITDYCCSDGTHSEQFQKYVKQRGYTLLSPAAYGKVLEEVGFVNVKAEDRTQMFVDVLKNEVAKTENIKDEFIKEFSESDYLYIVDGWKEKITRASDNGNQRWGLFYAEKSTCTKQ
ncbi:uncharacterized protein LOC141914452 [Tubulanus polymorphus]|uniref:uncharacterized protein LOC141901639 n=1 Tax=Tubulanus polymorphus TaxID=672921 RepID=UPI003DA25C26